MTRGSDVFDILLNLNAKDTAVEFMYNKHACAGKLILLEPTATKDMAHVWK